MDARAEEMRVFSFISMAAIVHFVDCFVLRVFTCLYFIISYFYYEFRFELAFMYLPECD